MDKEARQSEDSGTGAQPPPKPERPEDVKAKTLQEAFPDVDRNVVKAVLTASGGNLDNAFNALLGMSDPNYRPDSPQANVDESVDEHAILSGKPAGAEKSQLEKDEEYARMLQQQYEYGGFQPRGQTEQYGVHGDERSWMDEELPKIRDSISQGFNETRNRFTSFMGKMRSRVEAGMEDSPELSYMDPYRDDNGMQKQRQREYLSARRRQESPRHGVAYDSDPRVLGDDFSHLHLQAEDSSNPDNHAPPKPLRPETGSKPGSRWQPIRKESASKNRDPFELGDSGDEDERKTDPPIQLQMNDDTDKPDDGLQEPQIGSHDLDETRGSQK